MSYDDLCNCRKKLDGVLRKKLGNVGGGEVPDLLYQGAQTCSEGKKKKTQAFTVYNG